LNYHIIITVIKLVDITINKVFLRFMALDIGIAIITRLNLMLNIIKYNIIYLYKQ
jgi:hypothetical protein